MRRLTFLFCILSIAKAAWAAPLQIRVATYNASLNRSAAGQLASDLATTTNTQAKQVAEILQRVRPDVVLINEFDYDSAGLARDRFHDNYLAVSQNGQAPLSYPYRYAPPSNTGVTSGFDLDNANGYVATPGSTSTTKDRYANDCFGFGWFPGQYGFVVYSRFPIRFSDLRTFQNFLWKDMPAAALPDDSATPTANDWYSAAELNVVRLSSKNHCDIPIEVVPGQIFHLLASHPTPPAFDGSEDRNGRRNHDEIRFWADYVSSAGYIYDDAAKSGGLAGAQRFIVLGDLNADPLDGDSYLGAVNQLLQHPLLNASLTPASAGGPQQSQLQGGVNASQHGDPKYDTSDFYDGSGGAGNLHVDHVLPSKLGFSPVVGGVFWPLNTDSTYSLVLASDHRLVWLDVAIVPIISEAVGGLRAAREGNDIVLGWTAQSGITYRVQTSPDLGTWTDATSMTVSIDASLHARAVDAGAAGTRKFYRVVTTIEVP